MATQTLENRIKFLEEKNQDLRQLFNAQALLVQQQQAMQKEQAMQIQTLMSQMQQLCQQQQPPRQQQQWRQPPQRRPQRQMKPDTKTKSQIGRPNSRRATFQKDQKASTQGKKNEVVIRARSMSPASKDGHLQTKKRENLFYKICKYSEDACECDNYESYVHLCVKTRAEHLKANAVCRFCLDPKQTCNGVKREWLVHLDKDTHTWTKPGQAKFVITTK